MELELELDGCFSSVVALGALLELLELDGAALDGVLLEPAPAEPLRLPEPDGAALEDEEPDGALDGAALDEDEDDPLGWSFLLMSIEVDEELELGGVAVVPPADDVDDEVPGAFVAPEGAVDVDLSHAAISDAPSAKETATAIVDNLMRPPWLGYKR